MKTLADLKKIREKAQEEMKLRGSNVRVKIVVGMGTSGTVGAESFAGGDSATPSSFSGMIR